MLNETNVQATKFTISVECPTNIFGRDNYFYVLSDNQANANEAQQICIRSGGTLAETQKPLNAKQLYWIRCEETHSVGYVASIRIACFLSNN